MIRSRLRALDDSFDRLLRRHGTSLMGDHASAAPSRYRCAPYIGLIVVVATARLLGGQPLLPVAGGAVGFGFIFFVVLRQTSRTSSITDEAQRQQVAARRLQWSSLLLVAMAIAFGVARIWQVTALLLFLVVFFNGAVWAAQRYKPKPDR